MSRGTAWYRPEGGGFPRVSGDEPVIPDLKATNARFSPRERG